jgi:hypothetical protein
VLDAYVTVITLASVRAARIFEVVRRASGQAAEIAELWDTLGRNRRAGARMVIEHAASLGPLAAGLDLDRATDILWIFKRPGPLRRPGGGPRLARSRLHRLALRPDPARPAPTRRLGFALEDGHYGASIALRKIIRPSFC